MKPVTVAQQIGLEGLFMRLMHGQEGLRVVDASIMLNCIRANTNVTTIMIGECIADFMRLDS